MGLPPIITDRILRYLALDEQVADLCGFAFGALGLVVETHLGHGLDGEAGHEGLGHLLHRVTV